MSLGMHGILPYKKFLNISQERPIALMDSESGVLRALVSLHPDYVLTDELRQLDAIAALPTYALAEALLHERIDRPRESVTDFCVAAIAHVHMALISESRDVFFGCIGAVKPLVRDAKLKFGNDTESTSEPSAVLRMLDRLANVLNVLMLAFSGNFDAPSEAPSDKKREFNAREACFVLWLLGNVAGQQGWIQNNLSRSVRAIAHSFLPYEPNEPNKRTDNMCQVKQLRVQIVKPLCAAVRAVHARSILWQFPMRRMNLLLDEAKKQQRQARLFVSSATESRFKISHELEKAIYCDEDSTEAQYSFDDERAMLRMILQQNGFAFFSLGDAESLLLNCSSNVAWPMRLLGAHFNGVVTDDKKMRDEVVLALRDCSFASWTYKARFCPQYRFLCKYVSQLFDKHNIEAPCQALHNFFQ